MNVPNLGALSNSVGLLPELGKSVQIAQPFAHKLGFPERSMGPNLIHSARLS